MPSGTIWCKYNVGVNPNKLNTARDWCGGYYAWGETYEKDIHDYIWRKYKYTKDITDYYVTMNKYCDTEGCGNVDHKIILEPEDDAAYVWSKSNCKCHMPTIEQAEELEKYCSKRFINNYNKIEGLGVVIFKSTINDKELIIPVTGGWKVNNSNWIHDYVPFWLANMVEDKNKDDVDLKRRPNDRDNDYAAYVMLIGRYSDNQNSDKSYPAALQITNRSRQCGYPIRGVFNF